MKTKTSLLIFYLVCAAFVSSKAFAQDTLNQEVDSPLIPEEFISEPIYSDIELGIGYVTDDAYFFGRYNGLQTEGAYLVGDLSLIHISEPTRL